MHCYNCVRGFQHGPRRTMFPNSDASEATVRRIPAAEHPLIAVVDSSEEIVDVLAEILREDGFRADSFVPAVDSAPAQVAAFLSALRPDCCLFGVSFPFEQSWAAFRELRRLLP